MNSNEHFSFFKLDQAIASGTISPELQAHLNTCDRCRLHFGSCAPNRAPLPAWAQALAASPSPKPSGGVFESLVRWAHKFRYPLMVAAPAVLVILFLSRDVPNVARDHTSYVGVKAAGPAIWTYVRRSDKTFLWDGASPLVPGDRVRLKLDAASFNYVAALSRAGDGPWVVLWSGKAEAGSPLLLPVAWQIDEEAGPERLLVVMSTEPLAGQELAHAEASSNDKGRWSKELILPKTQLQKSVQGARWDASAL